MGRRWGHFRSGIPLMLVMWGLGGASAAEPLDEVRAATLYVKMICGKQVLGTGSGFVVKASPQDTYVVTNCHVAAPSDMTEPLTLVGVLHSGTPEERSIDLQILGVDPANDLALLRGEGLADPPKPLLLVDGIAPEVGQELSVVGFPFGKQLVLDERKENPVVSVSRVTVQRSYRGQFGVEREIPTVGNANHGNSGGPVVDSQGRLAGVLVTGSLIERHGVGIIPVEHVRNLWDGNCQPGGVGLVTRYGANIRAKFTVYRCDPFDTLSSVRLVILPVDQITPEMDCAAFHRLGADYFGQDVELPPMSGCVLSCEAALPDPGPKRQLFAYAVQATRRDGSTWFSQPEPFTYEGTAATSLALDLSLADPYLRGETPGSSASLPEDEGGEIGRLERKLGRTPLVALSQEEDSRVVQLDNAIKPAVAPLWESEGETCLVLDADGWLVRMALPSFEKIRACRPPACLPSWLGPGARPTPSDKPLPVALVRSRDHIVVLSSAACSPSVIGNEAWVHVIDPQRLASTAFFAVPGAVGLSAVPDSDRLLVRYFTGELGLLDPATGKVRLLCRTRRSTGLPVAGDDHLPVLPVESLSEAVLVASGSRVMIATESGVYALELSPNGSLVPPGAQTPAWPGLASIRQVPGATEALVVPAKQPESRPQLVSMPDLQRTPLLPGDWQCFDPVARQVAQVTADQRQRVFERLDLATGLSTKITWSEPESAPTHGYPMKPAKSVIVPHPRGNAYWIQSGDQVRWVEFGPAWVECQVDADGKPSGASPTAPEPPLPATETPPTPRGHILGKAADMTVSQFPTMDQDGAGAGLCWTHDAEAFLAVWKSGVVRRVGLDGLVLQSQHDLGKPCLGLGRSSLGPVVTLVEADKVELAVLDEQTLSPLRTVQLPKDSLVALGEGASIALAAVPGKGLAVIDLASGQALPVIGSVRNTNGQDELGVDAIAALALTPDGRNAYAVIDGRVISLQVAAGRLVLNGFLPDLPKSRANGLAVSADGFYLDIECRVGPQIRHVIRSTADPKQVLRDLATAQFVFDCGARQLFYRPPKPSPYYPFAGRSYVDGTPGGKPVRFVAGEHVLAHPRGNLLVTLGEDLHTLEYGWGYWR